MGLRQENHCRLRLIGVRRCGLLLLSGFFVFLTFAEHATLKSVPHPGAIIVKSLKPAESQRGSDVGQVKRTVPQQPAVVPASFLLFDFKQNLRQWPVVAGDISRSPPPPARSRNL